MVLIFLLAFGSIAPLVDARAFFILGYSLVDSGNNNNYLATTAWADSPPYGIDYPGRRATGRFSNGLNIPDLISQKLGYQNPIAIFEPRLQWEKAAYWCQRKQARNIQFVLQLFGSSLIRFEPYYIWLNTLYKAGARRVLVTGTGPMGCVPAELAIRGTNG
ncbi:GDSL esterase/lipase [Hibiscus syriacus]|uniref:GDSL esterase/lipase n=1 Tax=Hibiscus syriacus TaxID=106335 RepID=A0A6A3CT86_HIBSY|nr:GDSL esterase/lipase At4g28780-like [Hibiscus syriacus]KAE8731767.1 GDSL esterase/lipase [Hibiscus syriacus]